MELNWNILKEYLILCIESNTEPVRYKDVLTELDRVLEGFNPAEKFRHKSGRDVLTYHPDDKSINISEEFMIDAFNNNDDIDDISEILKGYISYKFNCDISSVSEEYYLKEEDFYELNSVGTKARSNKTCCSCGKLIPMGIPHKVAKFYPEYSSYPLHEECVEDFKETLI